MAKVKLSQVMADYQALHNSHVDYNLGSKLPHEFFENPEKPLVGIRELDCSGFFRGIVFRASGGNLLPPDGSWNERDWMVQQGWRQLAAYANVGRPEALNYNRLFVGWIPPVVVLGKQVKAGHIWFVCKGQTLECCGAGGVVRRPWNTLALRIRTPIAFEVPLGP